MSSIDADTIVIREAADEFLGCCTCAPVVHKLPAREREGKYYSATVGGVVRREEVIYPHLQEGDAILPVEKYLDWEHELTSSGTSTDTSIDGDTVYVRTHEMAQTDVREYKLIFFPGDSTAESNRVTTTRTLGQSSGTWKRSITYKRNVVTDTSDCSTTPQDITTVSNMSWSSVFNATDGQYDVSLFGWTVQTIDTAPCNGTNYATGSVTTQNNGDRKSTSGSLLPYIHDEDYSGHTIEINSTYTNVITWDTVMGEFDPEFDSQSWKSESSYVSYEQQLGHSEDGQRWPDAPSSIKRQRIREKFKDPSDGSFEGLYLEVEYEFRAQLIDDDGNAIGDFDEIISEAVSVVMTRPSSGDDLESEWIEYPLEVGKNIRLYPLRRKYYSKSPWIDY